MEEVFEKIIQIENRAKEVYQEALQEKEHLKEGLQQEIEQRGTEIREMSEAKIRQLIASGKEEVDERLDHINRLIREKLEQLDSHAAANAEQWEEIVFSNVIGD